MREENSIKLVCFDLGGVLVRICHTWGEACERAGVDVRGDAVGPRAELARREVTLLYSTGRMAESEWIERLSHAHDGLYTHAELTAIHHAITIEEYPGVGAVIDDLHRAGLATACLSNTDPTHWTRLVHHDGVKALSGAPRYPAIQRLGAHHASHLLGLAKPDQAMYRAFERATGRAGGEILFFDDLAENVAAARTAGWHAEGIDPAAGPAAQMRRHLDVYRLLSGALDP